MVNVQIITQSLPSIDLSNTPTLQTDNCEIPNHLKVYETKLFPLAKKPSLLGLSNLFPILWNLTWFQLS